MFVDRFGQCILREGDKEWKEKTYNLNDLLELQNKLMLMSSKGEHGREQVNKFTQVGPLSHLSISQEILYCVCLQT